MIPHEEVFEIPGDLSRLHVRRIARPIQPTRELGPRGAAFLRQSIEHRLEYLSACIEHGAVPDLKGRRHVDGEGEGARVAYEMVPVPDELAAHMDDLASAIPSCRKALEDGDLNGAWERLYALNGLCRDMAERTVAPDAEQGRAYRRRQSDRGTSGAKKRWGKNPAHAEVLRLITELAGRRDSLMGPQDLWPGLFAKLEEAELDPHEYDNPSRYGYRDGSITFEAFRKVVQRARQ